jgi:hypothetical protein
LKPNYEKAIPPKYDTRKNKEVKDDGKRREQERNKSVSDRDAEKR